MDRAAEIPRRRQGRIASPLGREALCGFPASRAALAYRIVLDASVGSLFADYFESCRRSNQNQPVGVESTAVRLSVWGGLGKCVLKFGFGHR
jgi:hypothetical protein